MSSTNPYSSVQKTSRIWCDRLVQMHDIRERHINIVYFNFSMSRSYRTMLFHECSIKTSIVWIERTPDFKPFSNNWVITVILLHAVCDYLQLDSYFSNLFRLTKNEPSKLRIIGPMLWESTSDRWIPLTQGPIVPKIRSSPCDELLKIQSSGVMGCIVICIVSYVLYNWFLRVELPSSNLYTLTRHSD